jgi:hypothetical protein
LRDAACVDAWVKPGTSLAAELRDVEPPVTCQKHMQDWNGKTGAMMWAGVAWTRMGAERREVVGDGLQVRVALFDHPQRDLTAEALDGSADRAAMPPGEPLHIARRIQVDGDEIRIEAFAAPRSGTPDRTVCVGAVDLTTRAGWAWICRPSDDGDAVATAERIISDDVPALRFWHTGNWNEPL